MRLIIECLEEKDLENSKQKIPLLKLATAVGFHLVVAAKGFGTLLSEALLEAGVDHLMLEAESNVGRTCGERMGMAVCGEKLGHNVDHYDRQREIRWTR